MASASPRETAEGNWVPLGSYWPRRKTGEKKKEKTETNVNSCPGSADHMLRIECLCLFPHSYTEALTSSVTVLRGGACVSGRVRTRRDARGRCEVPARRRLRRPGRGPSSEVEAGSSFTLEFPVSRTMKTKCLSHSVYGTLA